MRVGWGVKESAGRREINGDEGQCVEEESEGGGKEDEKE